MASQRVRIESVQTARLDAPASAAMVVLLDAVDDSADRQELGATAQRLARQGFSVWRVKPTPNCSRRAMFAAIDTATAALADEDDALPLLFAGVGRLASVAALAARARRGGPALGRWAAPRGDLATASALGPDLALGDTGCVLEPHSRHAGLVGGARAPEPVRLGTARHFARGSCTARVGPGD